MVRLSRFSPIFGCRHVSDLQGPSISFPRDHSGTGCVDVGSSFARCLLTSVSNYRWCIRPSQQLLQSASPQVHCEHRDQPFVQLTTRTHLYRRCLVLLFPTPPRRVGRSVTGPAISPVIPNEISPWISHNSELELLKASSTSVRHSNSSVGIDEGSNTPWYTARPICSKNEDRGSTEPT